MCTCDERRFDQAKEFITELTDKLIPMSAYNMQKLRFSIVQFNELSLTTTSLAEFDGPIRNFVDFVEPTKVKLFLTNKKAWITLTTSKSV